ncbi:HEPN domain-containing protein [Algoriphagus halophytocola]|uniref:HEPN domain-containing protein n=1 Tax=Algoriphagus halophytocola TaxID=2991499 RepID=A0ABY6MPR9_9BACT|nr:HEPN domain-containing protein [Algoriphagus sp. TR-M5]UZD24354.1 HEPN domain-containing protein [Algoriphagus sp. TR-M5]
MKVKTLTIGQDQAEHFRAFLQALVEKFQPIQIISFGRQTIENKLEGCFSSHWQQKQVHHCLLLIMESPTRIDYEVQEFTNHQYQQGQVTIICHGEASIKESLRENSRFFITVLRQGKTLYMKSGFHLLEDIPVYIPTKAREKAERHVHHRIPLADGFLEAAQESFQKNRYNLCVFLLHQTVEQACILLIRVHIAYRSEFHNLKRLLGLCRCFSDEPYQLLVGSDSKDRKLFDLLIKSYAKARYASSFLISQKDAEELFTKVSAFVDLTKKMCTVKMEELASLVPNTDIPHENSYNHGEN